MMSGLHPIGIHPDFPECTVFHNESEGFCHTLPYPTEEQLSAYYQREYREIRNEHPDENYIRFMDRRAAIQLDFILQSAHKSNFESAMDIGCGAGRLLKALQHRCNHLTGYEGDKAMAEFARATNTGENSRVIHGLFHPGNSQGRSQLIAMSHVLEHVPNPFDFLSTLRQEALLPEGYLFIEVPNDPERWVRKQIAWGIRGLAHINYYTETSLRNQLTRSGYEVLALRSFGFPLHRFIRQRKPKSALGRRADKLISSLFPQRFQMDVYDSSPRNHEKIYLQALARVR